MKDIVIGVVTGLVTAVVLIASAPANAQSGSIIDWAETVNKKLDGHMIMPMDGKHGVVEATFRRGEDGRPEAVVIRPAAPSMMRAARLTLDRLRDLPPLPDGYARTRIRMQLLVGGPGGGKAYYSRDQQMRAAALASNVRLAQLPRSVQVAAIGRR